MAGTPRFDKAGPALVDARWRARTAHPSRKRGLLALVDATGIAQFAELFGLLFRKLRTRPLVAWGESWHFSTHLGVSEVSRLGLLGGTTAHGVAARSADGRAESPGATASRRHA